MVQVGDGFCNGQSQAVAALCARPVGTVEAVEQVRERIWRNGTTNVVYGKADTGLFFCQGHGDGAVLHCVFDRVVHENGDELAQLCGVAGQDDVGFNARRIEPNAFFIGERFKRQTDAVYKVAYTLKSRSFLTGIWKSAPAFRPNLSFRRSVFCIQDQPEHAFVRLREAFESMVLNASVCRKRSGQIKRP